MKKRYFLLALFLIGCGGGGSSGSKNYVDVFTLAPVRGVLIKDANNQIAKYDETSKRYYFENSIAYPIEAVATENSYVDVDYDGKRSANDIKPKFSVLKSFTTKINPITNIYYGYYLDNNITQKDFVDIVRLKWGFDLRDDINENYAKALFAFYNYDLNHTANTLNDVDVEYENVSNFFNTYLNSYPDKIEYYSFYDSLVLLDKRLIERVNTLTKPEIKILRPPISIIAKNEDVDALDLKIDSDDVYVAAGADELVVLDKNLSLLGKSNADERSFGLSLYEDKNRCLYLADSIDGVKIFNVNSKIFQMSKIDTYMDENNETVPLTNSKVISVSGFNSKQNSKYFVTINTDDKGMYLIDASKWLSNCYADNLSYQDLLIPPTLKPTYDSEFSDNGEYLYAATDEGVQRYDLTSLDANNIEASVTTTDIHSEVPYNLMLLPNSNKMFVATNRGVNLYQIDNVGNLEFFNEYTLEGASDGYIPKMDIYNKFLIVTDGYRGVKVIKYDDNYNPMLCGVEYFAPLNNNSDIAKVRSVKYDNGYLYVGVDSLGVLKFKFVDILFRHCRGL